MSEKIRLFRTNFELTSQQDCDKFGKEKLNIRFLRRPPRGVAWKSEITIGDGKQKIKFNNDDFYVIGNVWIDLEEELKKGNKNFGKTYYYKEKYRKRMFVNAHETGEMIRIRLMDEKKMDQFALWVHCKGKGNKMKQMEKPEPYQTFYMTKAEYEILLLITLKFFREKMMSSEDPLMF